MATSDFFALPRELRDRVYVNLLDKQADFATAYSLRMRVENGPRLSCMLVSHQFTREYLDEVRRCTSIICVDKVVYQRPDRRSFKIPQSIRSVSCLELRIWLICGDDPCWAVREIQDHVDCMSRVVENVQARKVRILLGLEAEKTPQCTAANFNQYGELLKLDGLADVVVRVGDSRWYETGNAAPHTVYRYDAATKEFDFNAPAGSSANHRTTADFGFAEEHDMIAAEEDRSRARRRLGERRLGGRKLGGT